MEIGGKIIESALRTFMLAFQKRFTKGKKTIHVGIICMYFVCRKEKTGHMLVDFADAMEVNPFTVSQMYIKFIRLLNITQAFIDPTFYIQKYAVRLGMDNAVALSALRIIAGMGRSWIANEKRPTGLCVGALTLAAKGHGITKSQKEVQEVVQACNNDIAPKTNTNTTEEPKENEDSTQVENFNISAEENKLDLEDIDDEEVDAMLNDPSEIDCKAEKWTTENQDYLDKMAEKVSQISKKPTRKRKAPSINTESAALATADILKNKMPRALLNYTALQGLFQSGKEASTNATQTPELKETALI